MPNEPPVYLLAGGISGGAAYRDAVRMIFQQSGKAVPNVAYIGTASGDKRVFFFLISSIIKKAGPCHITMVPIAGKKYSMEKVRDILNSADVVFISGGDVEKGMQILADKNMVGFLRELYHIGKPFFGASAGAIMLAKHWVRWRDPDDDNTAETFPCLDIAPVICDTHAEADGFAELQVALSLEKEGASGYGIPSSSILKVYPDSKIEALGGPVWQFVKREGTVVREKDLMPLSWSSRP